MDLMTFQRLKPKIIQGNPLPDVFVTIEFSVPWSSLS